ncbi:MAG TPA: RDD family protein [Sunxiuqinia sp.]|nr:RDD family protein [Sunxiuqinia sp.]
MTDIRIQTAQNTVLAQNKASLGERIIATFLDLLLVAGYAILGAVIVKTMSLGGSVFWIFYFLPVYFYTLIQELAFNGQTVGKMIMKLKVAHCEGRDVPLTSYLLRWLLRLVDIWMFFGSIGTVSIVLSKKGQRIGDLAGNTIVVSVKNRPKIQDLLHKTNNIKNEVAVFSQANLLDDEDIEIIREVLAFGNQNGYYGRAGKMIMQTSNLMKKKLAVETELKPVQFLMQLLDDYYVLYK